MPKDKNLEQEKKIRDIRSEQINKLSIYGMPKRVCHITIENDGDLFFIEAIKRTLEKLVTLDASIFSDELQYLHDVDNGNIIYIQAGSQEKIITLQTTEHKNDSQNA